MSERTRYLMGRLATTALILLGAMVMLFALSAIVPGDPATALLGPQATPEYARQFIVAMGLDRPWYVRLWLFLRNVLTGDLGVDLLSGKPVLGIVLAVLPYTFVLTFVSLGLAVLLGVPLGCFAATHRGSAFDHVLAFGSVTMIAIPSFVVAIFLLLIFSLWLNWLPVLGVGDTTSWVDQGKRLILPVIAICVGWIGFIARLIRSSMLEVLEENYIRTSRAFGLSNSLVIYTYALKNACIPTLAVLGLGLGRLMSNAVLIEIVFARPGLGRLIYDAIATRNFPVLQGAVLVVVLIFTLTNLLVDLSYSAIDPRIRRGGAGAAAPSGATP